MPAPIARNYGQAPYGPALLDALAAETEQDAYADVVEPEPEPDPLDDFWARAPAEELAGELKHKRSAYFDAAERRGLTTMWKLAYAQHYGQDPNNLTSFETQQIGPDGDLGELLMFRINETRSYSRQQVAMAAGARPAFKCVTTNDDFASAAQIETADATVTALYRADMSEEKEREIEEGETLFGYSFGWMRWDDEAGADVTVKTDEIVQRQVPGGGGTIQGRGRKQLKSGMPRGECKYPWDVVRDPRRRRDHSWCIVDEDVSRWELIARFPEHADQLKAAKADKREMSALRFAWDDKSQTDDDVVVEHFYYRCSPELPEGRYVGICSGVPLWDLPCPVPRGLPIEELCSARIICTSFGYADLWDLMSINQGIDQLFSDAITTLAGNVRATMVMTKGSGYDADQLADGKRVLLADRDANPPTYVAPPELPQSWKVVLDCLYRAMQSVSGQNAAARGDAEGVKSGQHAALLHTIALEYQSARQAAIDSFRERWANLMLDMVRLNASYPLLIEVAGESERPYATQFSKQDASGIHRVYVETANPMLRSAAGRLELWNAVKDQPPDQRAASIEMITTGQSRPATRRDRASNLRLKWESERLMRGIPCAVSSLDDPIKHLACHAADFYALSVMPDAAEEGSPTAVAVGVLLQHVQEHINQQYRGDPMLYALLGFPPPPPKPKPQPGAPPGPNVPPPAPHDPAAGAKQHMAAPPSDHAADQRPGQTPPVGGKQVDEASGVRLPTLPSPPPGSAAQPTGAPA